MNDKRYIGKRAKWLILLAAILIPALVTATVAITYSYSTSTTPQAQEVYLTTGPNYATANAMGMFYVTLTSSSVANGATIDINSTSYSGTTYLLDVLEVYNASLPKGSSLTITITTQLPSGVTMYYDTTGAATYSSPGTPVTSGSAISVTLPTSAGPILYFSFALTGGTSGSGSFTITYVVS
ncbi:MAG: hypothetical protein QW292_13930 [Candidatus Parvarchaeota archaeon]